MYDMTTRSYIVQKIITEGSHHIDDFVKMYLEANIQQGDEYGKWQFVYNYTRKHISMVTIDRIIHIYGTQNLIDKLIEYYCEIYDNIDILKKKYMSYETEDDIKRNLTMMILYNAIHCTTYLY